LADGKLKAIFDTKNDLNDISPTFYGIPSFDLEREHYFYGRVDKEGDAIILDSNFLQGVESAEGANNLVVDFVLEAFKSLKANYRKVTRSGLLKTSVFYRNLKVHKSYPYGDLNTKYTNHITLMYKNFVDKYLSINRRADKIRNFKDFVKEFLRYSLRICHYYPVTKTGFITSVHCSPFVGGMTLEVAPEQHGILNSAVLAKYFDDDYFDFWVKHVAKFGFMVDKNAPWRLVFNVGSGYPPKNPENLTGGQLFMNKVGVSYENVFQYRYDKAYKTEVYNLQKEMLSLYKTFYQQYSTYEKEEFLPAPGGGLYRAKIKCTRHDREPPPLYLPAVYKAFMPGSGEATGWTPTEPDYEYWLKILLKLRLTETRQYHTPKDFGSRVETMIEKYRLFGHEETFRYINDLTKGFLVTKFNMKGKNWHGVSDAEYEHRLRDAREKAENPADRVQYSLTGCKNTTGS